MKKNEKNGFIAMLVLSVVVVVVFTLGYGVINMMGTNSILILNEKRIVAEIGEEVNFNVEDILDSPNGDIKKNATIRIGGMESMDEAGSITLNTEKYSVGEYVGNIKYNEESVEFVFKIQDTTPPAHTNYRDVIVIEQSALGVELEKYFDVHDFSSYEVTIENEENVNFDIVGSYSIEVKAVDKYENSDNRKCAINVVSTSYAYRYGVTEMKDGSKPESSGMAAYRIEQENNKVDDSENDEYIAQRIAEIQKENESSSSANKKEDTKENNGSNQTANTDKDSGTSGNQNTNTNDNSNTTNKEPVPPTPQQPEAVEPAPIAPDPGADKVGNTGVWHTSWINAWSYAQSLRWDVNSQWYSKNYDIWNVNGYGYTVNFKR